jgi:hypothetical protein
MRNSSLYLEAQLTKALSELFVAKGIAPPIPIAEMAETLAGKMAGYGSLAAHQNAEGKLELPPGIQEKLRLLEQHKAEQQKEVPK